MSATSGDAKETKVLSSGAVAGIIIALLVLCFCGLVAWTTLRCRQRQHPGRSIRPFLDFGCTQDPKPSSKSQQSASSAGLHAPHDPERPLPPIPDEGISWQLPNSSALSIATRSRPQSEAVPPVPPLPTRLMVVANDRVYELSCATL